VSREHESCRESTSRVTVLVTNEKHASCQSPFWSRNTPTRRRLRGERWLGRTTAVRAPLHEQPRRVSHRSGDERKARVVSVTVLVTKHADAAAAARRAQWLRRTTAVRAPLHELPRRVSHRSGDERKHVDAAAAARRAQRLRLTTAVRALHEQPPLVRQCARARRRGVGRQPAALTAGGGDAASARRRAVCRRRARGCPPTPRGGLSRRSRLRRRRLTTERRPDDAATGTRRTRQRKCEPPSLARRRVS
jgi:hypothetical protein